MELYKDVQNGFIEMIFGPRWTYIATVRTFLQNFLATTLADNKKADVISMAASELLENAVKYASSEGTKICVRHNKEDNKLYLLVENFSNKDNIDILMKEVAFINNGDPEKIYLKKMQEAALRTDGKSLLGLARIRYEGNTEIDIKIENDLVKTSLEFDLK